MVRLGSRLVYKRLGAASLDADDSQLCIAAGLGGDWWTLKVCEIALCWERAEMRLDKKQQ